MSDTVNKLHTFTGDDNHSLTIDLSDVIAVRACRIPDPIVPLPLRFKSELSMLNIRQEIERMREEMAG